MSFTPVTDREDPILVIEDDAPVAEVMVAMLEDEGYLVEHVPNVDQAMQFLAGRKARLLLCDISLPGPMNGLALANALKQSNPMIRIILMTGHEQKAIEAASNFVVLQKPFGLKELARIVAWVLKDGGSSYLETPPPDHIRDLLH